MRVMTDWQPMQSFLSSRSIIRAAELNLLQSAEQVLAQAKREADRLMETASAQAAQLRSQAQQSASEFLAEERARGYAQGVRLGQESLAGLLSENQTQLARSWREQDLKMSQIVLSIVAKVLSESDAQQHFFTSVTQRVLRATGEQQFLVFRVCSGQLELARTSIDAVLARTGAPNFVQVIGQEQLPIGACIVETEHAQINASLDHQLATLQQAIAAAFCDQNREMPQTETSK